MIVIVGASASGKTEISKILQKDYKYNKCITTTTRPKRDMEIDDVDYHFIDKNEFEIRLKNDEFVEHTLYNDNYYGINKKDINKNALVIVDPTGANNLLDKLKDNIFLVYVETNKKLRFKRMINRGDNIELVKSRIKNDKKIFKRKNLLKIDLLLKNKKHSLTELAKEVHERYQEYQRRING